MLVDSLDDCDLSAGLDCERMAPSDDASKDLISWLKGSGFGLCLSLSLCLLFSPTATGEGVE